MSIVDDRRRLLLPPTIDAHNRRYLATHEDHLGVVSCRGVIAVPWVRFGALGTPTRGDIKGVIASRRNARSLCMYSLYLKEPWGVLVRG